MSQSGWPILCPVCGNDGPRFTRDYQLENHLRENHPGYTGSISADNPSVTPDVQKTPGQEQTNSADSSIRTQNYQQHLYEQRRAELVQLLGTERVAKMEKELFDDYLLYGVRRSADDPPLRGLFHPSGDSSNGESVT